MRASRWLALVARAFSVGRPEVRVCPCVYLLFACACVVGACSAGKSQLRSFQRYRGLYTVGFRGLSGTGFFWSLTLL